MNLLGHWLGYSFLQSVFRIVLESNSASFFDIRLSARGLAESVGSLHDLRRSFRFAQLF